MSEPSVISQLRNFQTQTSPTVEETIQNNGVVLYKRKKYFLQDFKDSISFLGIVVIIMIYLRDISMLRLILRGYNQMTLANPFPRHPDTIPLTDLNKRALTKFLLIGILFSNGFCFLNHLLFGIVDERFTSDGYINCGLTIQFIGERVPTSRFELLALDLLITVLQLLYHSLMCVIDDSEVLRTVDQSDESGESNYKKQLDSDGYNGNVELLSIDLYENVKNVLNYQETLQYPSFRPPQEASTNNLPTPGGFV